MIDFENTKNERRERVFQMLFAMDSHKEMLCEDCFKAFYDDGEDVPEAGYVHDTFIGAAEYAPKADELVSTDSKNWSTSRMSGVTRAILRLAVYELMNTETPPRVILSQAVELSKKYGDDAEPAFINGILNRIAREANKL